MRHREILRARYDRVDWDRKRLFIPEGKAGEREQPLTRALVDALGTQRAIEEDKDGWVFPAVLKKQSKAGHRTNMARPFTRAVIAAQLDPKKVTPHTMRHTAITRLIQAGVDLPTIQRISGHKTLAMVLRYTHVEGSHVDAAVNRINFDRGTPVTPKLHTGRPHSRLTRGLVVNVSYGKTMPKVVEVRPASSSLFSEPKSLFKGNLQGISWRTGFAMASGAP